MRKAFLEFLAETGSIPTDRLEEFWNLLPRAPEPIGSIAFRHGMISSGDIDIILDEQRKDYKVFGEIAMAMGMLSREQVETLLHVQQMRAAVEIAEALALARLCPIAEMRDRLGQFFSNENVDVVGSPA